MDKNFCTNCSTENESEYVYCKNCGAQLKPDKEAPPAGNPNPVYTNPTPVPPQNSYQYGQGYPNIDFDGVSTEEMNFYIGKNANKIFPKFMKMQITGSKISWCWPVAILGFLFGPLGAAFWFFYRKMYKHATIFTLIGAVLTLIITIFTPTVSEDMTVALEEAISTYNFNAILEAVANMDTSSLLITYIVSLIENTASIASGVVCGILGLHWYKQNAIAKIKDYRISQIDPRYYHFGLVSIGGVSGGMLAISIVIFCIVSSLSSIVATIINNLI